MSSEFFPGERTNEEFEASQALFDHVRSTIGDESIMALINEAEVAQGEGLVGAFLEEQADFSLVVDWAQGRISVLSFADHTVHSVSIAEAMEQLLPEAD